MEDTVKESVSEIEILFEDEDFLFINKPYDLIINSDDVNKQDTVHRILSRQLSLRNNYENDNQINNLKHGFHFVNRLDYSTSGVMCLSKSKKGARVAGNLFQSREVNKIYVALLRGHLQSQYILVDVPVGYDVRYLNDNKMMCTADEYMTQGKESKTEIILLETGYLEDEEVSFVVLKPHTGRRHQLRVHCKHIGHPILGDYTYSNRLDVKPHRMYLHAYRLILPLPTKTVEVTALENFTKIKWRSLKEYNSLESILRQKNF